MSIYTFQTQHSINKFLEWENSHLYHKLGLHWRLTKKRCDSSSMMEYVSYLIYLGTLIYVNILVILTIIN